MPTPLLSIITLFAVLGLFPIFAQTQNPKEAISGAEEGAEIHQDGKSLDREYYEYYFKTLPNTDIVEKAKLEYNLIRHLKLELRKRDAVKMTPEELKKVTSAAVRYERVFEDSIWMRGIRNQMKYIKFKDYMYVIIYEKYYCFISYEMNPSRYIQEPFQVQLIFQKENPFNTILPAP
ncbi:hypothetical protein LEP1GSC050_0416 [Leptospira broomii serovar Hurstbridge str. 5399]|uniref:Uncharacterized protein n=1 Tax=Leptospira broomii serovar Hurstbridge str. 5399 TaxID=1049789 RepID=T0FEV8_9LEPT|nr:hypothetical protein [Leptospira broomii]EQA46421.1 hypothetical protein LEP1GSC050_0416 [Leptospira broomii serovar Hurstbridge str. 5399]